MTSSELKYLITVDLLEKRSDGAKFMDAVAETGVSKVSVYHGLEKLINQSLIQRRDKKFFLTEVGKDKIKEYSACIDFIADKYMKLCGLAKNQAYKDAIETCCIVSDNCRKALVVFLSKKIK